MLNGHFAEHWMDDGKPAGGVSSGRGFTISWQNGPLGNGSDRKEPNGAFVEDVIQAVLGRLRFYQLSEFACQSNAEAIDHLQSAAAALDSRTKDRESRGVDGTHAK